MKGQAVKINSLRAWLLAARPKTLTGAVVPVAIGLAAAYHDASALNGQTFNSTFNSTIYNLQSTFNTAPALLCLLFAVLMQIDANFINDYFDWRKGNDEKETRLGPERACSMGWVTPRAMVGAILLTTCLACLAGLPLAFIGGWEMVLVGIACVVFCFLYTTTLSYIALGDVLVLVFFGLVPVCCTYYLQTGEISLWVVILSIACGLTIDNLLIVNNYRDIDNDRSVGKRTLIVLLGRNAGLMLYFLLGFASAIIVCAYAGFDVRTLLMLPYLLLHRKAYMQMRLLNGRELNKVLGMTARNILIFGISAVLVILL